MTIPRAAFLGKPEGEGWGAVYIHELPLPQPLDNMKRALVWGMETACANVTAEPRVERLNTSCTVVKFQA